MHVHKYLHVHIEKMDPEFKTISGDCFNLCSIIYLRMTHLINWNIEFSLPFFYRILNKTLWNICFRTVFTVYFSCYWMGPTALNNSNNIYVCSLTLNNHNYVFWVCKRLKSCITIHAYSSPHWTEYMYNFSTICSFLSFWPY